MIVRKRDTGPVSALLMQKYEPTLPIKKIKELSDAKFFSALADIMCHEEE